LLLDGAHNRDGVATLTAALRDHFPGRRPTLVLGALADKDWREMAQALVPLAGRVITAPVASGRTVSAEELRAACVATGAGRLSVSNLFRAVDIDASLVSAGTSVVLTGSSSANIITGSVGNDVVAGGGGTDVLIGGDGDDTFRLTLDQIQNVSTGVLNVFGGKATLSGSTYSASTDSSRAIRPRVRRTFIRS
jgi:Ca2+-binding RTX toxin-like protein